MAKGFHLWLTQIQALIICGSSFRNQFSHSVVSSSLRPHGLSTPGVPVHHQLPELAQTHGHRVGDAIQPSHPRHPLLLLPSIFPSIRVFSNESVLSVRWPKHWSFSFSISASNEYSGLISFRTDYFQKQQIENFNPQPQPLGVFPHGYTTHFFRCCRLAPSTPAVFVAGEELLSEL